MIAAGMVMAPAGFRGKHYRDSLSTFPGLIPLFQDAANIPPEALTQATVEGTHLRPCIATFDLNELSGQAEKLLLNNEKKLVKLPILRRQKGAISVLIRSPLPLSLLTGISFRSSEDKKLFESAAKSTSNVDLSNLEVEVEESLFGNDSEFRWPEPELGAGGVPPARGQILGGILAMLFHASNRSILGLAAFRVATASADDADQEVLRLDPILAALQNWVEGTEIEGLPAKLFWGAIQSLVDIQTMERPPRPVDAVLSYLEGQLDRLAEDKYRPRLEGLISDMRGCFSLNTGTTTELFERHKGTLSRSLLLFCLREHCVDLLEFTHPLINSSEYVAASILFGARDTWIGLPREFRHPLLAPYVSHAMSVAEHRKTTNGKGQYGINFSSQPARPKPLLELFSLHQEGELDDLEKIKLSLAQNCGWHDCLQYKITLGDGDHPKVFERNGVELLVPGAVSAVLEIIQEPFYRHLRAWPPLPMNIDLETRKEISSTRIQSCG